MDFLGIPVITSDLLPSRPPTPAEDGRRIVRHGLADVLHWLGEDVGPVPGAPVHTMLLLPGYMAEQRIGFMVLDPSTAMAIKGGA